MKKRNAKTHVKNKKKIQYALRQAKILEKKPIPTRDEILKIQEEMAQEAKKLRKLLEPAWFLDNKSVKRTAVKKAVKKKTARRPAEKKKPKKQFKKRR